MCSINNIFFVSKINKFIKKHVFHTFVFDGDTRFLPVTSSCGVVIIFMSVVVILELGGIVELGILVSFLVIVKLDGTVELSILSDF